VANDDGSRLQTGGRVWFVALWLGAEAVGAILLALLGLSAVMWMEGVFALISAVFAMIYGSLRVLGGHEL